MSRKCVEVATLHGYTIEELQSKADITKRDYTRCLLQAVIMRYNGIKTPDIVKTLGKSNPTVADYIKRWNESPACLVDRRGKKISHPLADGILEDLKCIVVNKKPYDFGYPQTNWNSNNLARYITDRYGLNYSSSWTRRFLIRLGFTYQRGYIQTNKKELGIMEQLKL